MHTILSRFLAIGFEVSFPRTCALCGQELLFDARRLYPLCPSCEAGLHTLEGDRCVFCGKPLISEQGICMRCRSRKFHFDSVYPLWRYRSSIKDLVVAYKIRDMRRLAIFFADRISRLLESKHPGKTIIPVPFRKSKMREKGWDQVEDITRLLERRGLPVARCLMRLSGSSQKILDYSARLSNLTGKIQVIPKRQVPKQVVLLDDVLTTGATLSECARILKDHGAECVDALVLAAD